MSVVHERTTDHRFEQPRRHPADARLPRRRRERVHEVTECERLVVYDVESLSVVSAFNG